MKKILPFFLCLLIFPAYAQIFSGGRSDFHLAVEPRVGITYGSLGEYLYMQKSDGTWKKNSYLEWEEKPVWTFGVAAEGAYNHFGIQTYVDAGLPVGCGDMYDSDWKVDSQPDLKTTYSIHENTVQDHIATGISFWYDFSPEKRITIAPVVSATFSYQQFLAEHGEAWHGESGYNTTGGNVAWNDSAAKYYRKGLVADISYERQTFCTFVGIKVTLQGTKHLRAEYALFASPYAYVFARDIHYGWNTETRTQYKKRYTVDIQQTHFDYFKGSLAFYYVHSSIWEFGLTVTGQLSGVIKSDYYDENHDTGKRYKNKGYQGGFSTAEASVKLSAKAHLF